MTDGVRVKVRGADNVARTMGRAADAVRDHERLNALAARELVAEMRSRSPVRTGRLRGSLEADSGPELVRAGSSLRYAAAVEYGAPYRPAQPYARPALADFVPDYVEDLADALQDDLDRIKGV